MSSQQSQQSKSVNTSVDTSAESDRGKKPEELESTPGKRPWQVLDPSIADILRRAMEAEEQEDGVEDEEEEGGKGDDKGTSQLTLAEMQSQWSAQLSPEKKKEEAEWNRRMAGIPDPTTSRKSRRRGYRDTMTGMGRSVGGSSRGGRRPNTGGGMAGSVPVGLWDDVREHSKNNEATKDSDAGSGDSMAVEQLSPHDPKF
jgi:hypothetical protein